MRLYVNALTLTAFFHARDMYTVEYLSQLGCPWPALEKTKTDHLLAGLEQRGVEEGGVREPQPNKPNEEGDS